MRGALALLLTAALVLPAGAATPAAPAVPAAPRGVGGAAAAAPRVAQVSVVRFTGTLAIVPKGGRPRKVTEVPAPLDPGDLVATGPKGQADLQFRDGSRVNLGPGARFTVEEESSGLVSLFLARGKVWCAVSKLAGRRFQVKTPAAVAAVRGTEFSVEALGAARTSVEVFGGLVSVRGKVGDEALVGASHRVDVEKGVMGEVRHFEARPDAHMPVPPAATGARDGKAGADGDKEGGDKDKKEQDKDKKDKQAEKGRPERATLGAVEKGRADGAVEAGKTDATAEADDRKPVGRMTREQELASVTGFSLDATRFKEFVAIQADESVRRDMIESSAAFEQKAQLYQEGKTLVDAFGRRVRVEEYITRPAPDSFKFVSFNYRDNRTDFASVEVTANRTLPDNLASAGNLWFSPGTVAPPYFATKQRVTMSNGADSVVEVGVDGAPQLFDVPSGTLFDPGSGQFVGTPAAAYFRTMFGNRYEFVNGNGAAIDDVYFGSFRPAKNGDASTAGNAASGLMWRTQPVRVDVTDGSTTRARYWADAFTTYSANDGLAYAQTAVQPDPSVAHFVSERDYFNFRDTNGNGVLDFGEPGDAGHPGFFHDIAGRMNGTAFVPAAGAGTQSAGGDTIVFSDKNGGGTPTGNPTLTAAGLTMSQAQAFAQANPRDWMRGEEFAVDDMGRIMDSGPGFESSADLFLGQNFERRLTCSRFTAGDVDVVSSPALIFQAGGVASAQQSRVVPSTGP